MKPVRTAIALLALILISFSCRQENKNTLYNEKFRPQFHFTEPSGWMNDPNGLVYLDGEYHLFYQFFPDSTVWGPMHWGHAVSTDLVHWNNLPVALYPDTLGYIFSGSAVIDWKNRTGLQTGKNPPIVAMFTHHSDTRAKKGRIDFQNQSIAVSNDKGRTFVKYDHNPVIANRGEKDFRDPKVIWVETIQKWVVVLAVGNKVQFFSSPDLKSWEFLSEFGSDSGAHGGVWECPDLFRLKSGGNDKWVLLVNINPGAPNGGSGTQYFIGDFNGKEFINNNPKETTLWLDYGPDEYAGVTWSDIPDNDGRRLFLGWMSNWSYAQVTPTKEWRSANTLPRSLKLKNTASGLRLSSKPVKELESLREAGKKLKINSLVSVLISGLNEIKLDIDLSGSSSDEFGLTFSNGRGEQLIVGYDKKSNRFYSDRSKSGITGFSPEFPKLSYAPRISSEDTLKFHIFLDHSSLELFADDGLTVMTGIFFPTEDFDHVALFQNNGTAKLEEFKIYSLRSIWNE